MSSAKSFDKRSPVNGKVIARVAEAGAAEVDQAVKAARAALRGPWGKLTLADRVDLLYAVANGINQRFDDFLEAEVADTGKPVSLAKHLDIPRGAANFKIFADVVKNVSERILRNGDARWAGRDQLRSADTGGGGGGRLSVEPTAAADDVEGRSGARLR